MESPCTLVCSIDQDTGHCLGCGRTLDEIGRWTLYTDAERATLMRELPGRVDAMGLSAVPARSRRARRAKRSAP